MVGSGDGDLVSVWSCSRSLLCMFGLGRRGLKIFADISISQARFLLAGSVKGKNSANSSASQQRHKTEGARAPALRQEGAGELGEMHGDENLLSTLLDRYCCRPHFFT